jgi:hypothetical protein
MDLKGLNLDALVSGIRQSASEYARHFSGVVEQKITELRAATDAARMLEKLPTGELIQRAAVASVFEVRMPDASVGVQDITLREGSYIEMVMYSDRMGNMRYQSQIGRSVVLKPGKTYRALFFLLEQEPAVEGRDR